MNDSQAVPPGTRGTVNYVDDLGTIHMNWDNGRTLGICPQEDSFRKLREQENMERRSRIVGKSTSLTTDARELAIEKIGGTMPEDLPTPDKSISQLEKEHMKRLKEKAKNGQLMLDE